MPTMIAPRSHRVPEPDSGALEAYMRGVLRHPLMTPQEERERAEQIVALRAAHWRQILGYAPLIEAIVPLAEKELLEEKGIERAPVIEACAKTVATARAVRDRDRLRTRQEFAACVWGLAELLAEVDRECLLADRVVADLRGLAEGSPTNELKANLPRRGSRPFAEYLAEVGKTSGRLAAARADFARANLRLVVRMANRLRNLGLSKPDLVQEGNIGLLKAVDRFEPARGFRFSTYASWWIRHHMRRALVNRGRTVRVPQHLHTLAQKATKARRDLRSQLGREPRPDELAKAVGVSEERIEMAQRALSAAPLSLDARLSEEDPRTVLDTLETPEEASPGEQLDAHRLAAQVRVAIKHLSPIEQDIICRRFGMDGDAQTLAEVGELHSLSRERIRQLQVLALKHLRERMESALQGAKS